MQLDTWLSRREWNYQNLADALGCSHEYARLLAKRRRRPSLPVAQKIIEVTAGDVTLTDLIEGVSEADDEPPVAAAE